MSKSKDVVFIPSDDKKLFEKLVAEKLPELFKLLPELDEVQKWMIESAIKEGIVVGYKYGIIFERGSTS